MKGAVLVTGGAKRIGRAVCDELRARGWTVLVHSRDASNPLRADFSAPGAAEELFAAACRAAPGLCAVVNSASEFSLAADLPPGGAARLLRVNAEVPARLAELLAARLRAAGGSGAVVNLLDARVLHAPPLREAASATPYERSKIALRDATREQARALAPVLRVNAVAPGPVLPPADPSCAEPGGGILLARRPSPGDVARAVAFLLEAEAVTGQVLAVDSGQSLLRR